MKIKQLKAILIVFILVLFSVIYSCEKDNPVNIKSYQPSALSKTRPEIPEAVYYDINNDLIKDFIIDYRLLMIDFLTSYDMIIGSITPLEGNKLLHQQGIGILFLSENDTIFLTERESLSWHSSPAALVRISSTEYPENYWPKEWSIVGDTTRKFHYAGIKIKKNNDFLVGWLKVKIDKMTGGIEIVNKEFINNNYIVIAE